MREALKVVGAEVEEFWEKLCFAVVVGKPKESIVRTTSGDGGWNDLTLNVDVAMDLRNMELKLEERS